MIIETTYTAGTIWIPGRARINTAIRISGRIYQKSGLIPVPGQTDDDFLESVARQMRDNAILRGNSNN